MYEEIDKKFNKDLDYLKLCSEITDSRYTNDVIFNTHDVKCGTRIMYDNMYGKILTFIHQALDEEARIIYEAVIKTEDCSDCPFGDVCDYEKNGCVLKIHESEGYE